MCRISPPQIISARQQKLRISAIFGTGRLQTVYTDFGGVSEREDRQTAKNGVRARWRSENPSGGDGRA